MPDDRKKQSEIIKAMAKKHGFDDCGISEAVPLNKEANYLKQWLRENRHGEMQFMNNYFEKRTNPAKLVPGTKSIVSVIHNYYPGSPEPSDTYKISKYAYGRDYHKVVKKKLKGLFKSIQENIGEEITGRYFVDSAPVMEKVWAEKAGLGWIGKNTNLITKKHGSYVFLGEIFLNIELEYDNRPVKDYCGSCKKCIEACPTNALYAPYHIDASRCISYLTIEKKGQLPPQMKDLLNDWIFGCDICQNVCPWNQNLSVHQEPELKPHPAIFELSKNDWEHLSQDKYNELFDRSAIKRTGYRGLLRNIDANRDSRQR
ncbi:MAG: tRNA epoxyqueuosine(34) reductase QueG [Bacteroidales bacterium]